ncbi:MAG: hypothetical protein ACI4F7_07745 [Acutalibacteraceae bacterium]
MKLGVILQARPALDKLAGCELSPKYLYRVSKMLSKVNKELKFIDENRNKLIQELGQEISGGEWKVKDENLTEFVKRLNEVLDVDTEEDIPVISIPTTENIKLSYKDLDLLSGFIELQELDEE